MRLFRSLPVVAAALAATAALAPQAAAQGTVSLTLTGPAFTGTNAVIGSNPIGPFNLQRNNPTSSFQAFSIDFDGAQTTGMTWTARSVSIATLATSQTDFNAFVKSLGTASTQGTLGSTFDAATTAAWQQRLRAAAHLTSGFGTSPTTSWDEQQVAIWQLFSTASPAASDAAAATTLRTNAMTFAGANPNNFGSWRVLIDNNAYNTAYTGTLNRAFITTSTSVVPEPSTYALMATGLVALGVAARRRRGAVAGGATTA